MGIRLRGVRNEKVTRDLALWIRDLRAVPGERRRNSARTGQIRRWLLNGETRAFQWIIAHLNGDIYRINGQHSSAEIVSLIDEGRDINIDAVIEEYDIDTHGDARKLWSMVDQKVSSRTSADILATFLQEEPSLNGIKKKVAKLCLSAVAIDTFGAGYTNKVTDHDKCEALLDKSDFAQWANSTVRNDCAFLMRVGVFYAMLLTFKLNKASADDFWKSVANGSNTNPQSGPRRIQVELLRYAADQGVGSRSGKPTIKWYDMADWCIAAWNAWRKGDDIKRFRRNRHGNIRNPE